MKYIAIMDVADNYDSAEFGNKEDAIKHCDHMYGYLTARERAKANYCVIESANPDEDSMNHFDGDCVWRAYDTDEIEDKAFDMLCEFYDGKEEPTADEVGCKANDIVASLMEYADRKTIDRVADSITDTWIKNN